jgi:hypothetical protein
MTEQTTLAFQTGFITVMFLLILIALAIVLKCIGSEKIFRFILETLKVVGLLFICIILLTIIGNSVITIKEFLWIT